MRLLMLALLTVPVHAATISGNASAMISYTICSDHFNAATCQTTSLADSDTGPSSTVSINSIPGLERATAIATYGFVSANAYSNTGLFGPLGAPTLGIPNTVYGTASSNAHFDDVIHFRGDSSVGYLDAAVEFFCCYYYDGEGGTSFQIGNAHGSAGGGVTVHLVTQFALNGSVPISANAGASASDFAPRDPNDAAENGVASVRLVSLTLTDSAGNRLPSPLYYSDSGTRYLGEATYIPEPSTVCAAFGMGLLFIMRKKVNRGLTRL